MPENFKDKALERERAHKAGDFNHTMEIDDTKEWEGVYPNSLDNEMQGYNYGDKVKVNYGYGYDNDYRYNKYQKIYNKNTGYNPGNHWNKRTGWGFDAVTSLLSLIQTLILKVHTTTMITWDGAVITTGTE